VTLRRVRPLLEFALFFARECLDVLREQVLSQLAVFGDAPVPFHGVSDLDHALSEALAFEPRLD